MSLKFTSVKVIFYFQTEYINSASTENKTEIVSYLCIFHHLPNV